MKINCGPSKAEREAALRALGEQQVVELRNWHFKFAWWPTQVGSGDCRWLEMIERRYPYARFEEYAIRNEWVWEIVRGRPEYRAVTKQTQSTVGRP